MRQIGISVKRTAFGQRLALPDYATPGSVGMDLCAALDSILTLAPRARALVPTGLMIALPVGYEAQVRSRSGLAVKHGLQVLNAPGTIDQDYRGEIKVILINHGEEPFRVEPGMRIAQMLIAPVVRAALVEVCDLDETERAAGGFGSTGC